MTVDRRSLAAIGRTARLELTFSPRGGRTVLVHAYAEPPFRVGNAFDVDGAAYLVIVCAAPGVFAGDHLRQAIRVERGARVLLASQSAMQVHPSDAREAARLDHEYIVEAGGELHCHWDPIIPFAGARLAQRFELQLARGATLYWSDALMSGRCGSGEAWQFDSLDHELRLTVEGALKYLERYRLVPAESDPRARWSAGAADYVGTTVVCHERADAAFAEDVHRRLDALDGQRSAVDCVEPGLCVGRFVGADGPAFLRARSQMRSAALENVFASPELIARR